MVRRWVSSSGSVRRHEASPFLARASIAMTAARAWAGMLNCSVESDEGMG
jgi:hypothetical protein